MLGTQKLIWLILSISVPFAGMAYGGSLEDSLLAGSTARLDVKGVDLAIRRGAKVDQPLPHPDAQDITKTPIQLALNALIDERNADSVLKAERILKLLFKAGAKLTGDKDEMFWAISGGHEKILSLFLDNGASPHTRINGYTAAELAIKYDKPKLLPILYGRGVTRVDEKTTAQIQFVQAASLQDRLKMRFAIADGAEVNDPDPAGSFAIVSIFSMPLIEPDGYEAVKWLLVSDADPKLVELSIEKNTALHNVIKRNSYQSKDYFTAAAIAEILIQKGANVSAVDSLGRTPLHYAAQNSNIHAMRILLSHGAKVMARDVFRKTPMDMAVSGDAITLLKAAGAKEQ